MGNWNNKSFKLTASACMELSVSENQLIPTFVEYLRTRFKIEDAVVQARSVFIATGEEVNLPTYASPGALVLINSEGKQELESHNPSPVRHAAILLVRDMLSQL